MKYAKHTRPNGAALHEAKVLIDALPWIKNVTGKTIVIKYGGSAMVDEGLRTDVMNDIVLLKLIGANPILVHGGGKEISDAMARSNIPVEFKNGQRVTTPEAMDLVREVLIGKVNQDLVSALNAHGMIAVGVSGADAGVLMAEPMDSALGRVGRVTRINRALLDDLIAHDYIPVVASVALGEDGGFYNVNADKAAGALAGAVNANKVIYLTDVDGVYENFEDKESLISNMTLSDTEQMIEAREISSGMIPKLESCVQALKAGVFRAHILNGTMPHSLLLELLTSTGVGTTIHATDEACKYDAHPLGQFAAKLMENVDAQSMLVGEE